MKYIKKLAKRDARQAEFDAMTAGYDDEANGDKRRRSDGATFHRPGAIK